MTPQREEFFNAPSLAQPSVTHKIAYYEWGTATSKDIAFSVHGLTRNGRDFDFIAEKLAADGFRVISVDMPGRGKSEWFKDKQAYNYISYVTDITLLITHLALDKVHWIGTSMGGIIGMMMAAEQPQRVKSLVLNDIGSFISADALRRLGGYVGTWTNFDSREEAERALRKAYAPFGLTEERHWRHMFDHSLERNESGGWRAAYDPAIGDPLRDAEKIQDVDLVHFWDRVHCPVLVLRGEESDILSAATAKAMAAHPNVTLHSFPGVGHAPALASDEQISIVHRWLKSQR